MTFKKREMPREQLLKSTDEYFTKFTLFIYIAKMFKSQVHILGSFPKGKSTKLGGSNQNKN